MILKQVAEQAWAEDVVNDETSKGEVVVETYRGTGVVALHGGLVGEVRSREKESPPGYAKGNSHVNTCGDLVTLIAERWADRGVQMVGGTDHGIDAGLSLGVFQGMALET
jgi:hypothetical protein